MNHLKRTKEYIDECPNDDGSSLPYAHSNGCGLCGNVEVITFYEPRGKEYQRDMYCEGVWVGIETRKFVSLEEAKKLGYKPQ